jgi:hypothetical protein
MKTSSLLGTAFAALLIASPGLALAGTTAGANSGTHANTTTATTAPYAAIGNGGYDGTAMPIPSDNGNADKDNTANMRPSQRNPMLADNGTVRAGKLIGTDIYSDHNQQLGSVDDVLIGRKGVWVVISDNNKQVAVPFQELKFGNSDVNGHDKAVLPNMTQAQLNQHPAFYYDATKYAKNNGNGNVGAMNNH